MRARGTSPPAEPEKVIIVGHGQIELLLALLRAGVARVECHAPDRGPHPARGQADRVILCMSGSDAELRYALRRFAPALKSSGTLELRHAADDPCSVREALFHAGFSAVERLPRHDGGSVWRATNYAAALAEAA